MFWIRQLWLAVMFRKCRHRIWLKNNLFGIWFLCDQVYESAYFIQIDSDSYVWIDWVLCSLDFFWQQCRILRLMYISILPPDVPLSFITTYLCWTMQNTTEHPSVVFFTMTAFWCSLMWNSFEIIARSDYNFAGRKKINYWTSLLLAVCRS